MKQWWNWKTTPKLLKLNYSSRTSRTSAKPCDTLYIMPNEKKILYFCFCLKRKRGWLKYIFSEKWWWMCVCVYVVGVVFIYVHVHVCVSVLFVCLNVFYKQVSMLDICVIAVGYGGIRSTFWMSFCNSSICFSCETRSFSFSRACLIWAFWNDRNTMS